jgi:hypothetical protein
VKSGISDFWVTVLEVLNYNRDHGTNLLNIVDVFSNLRESHKSSVFVSPVSIIGNSVLDNLTKDWETNLITNSRNELVNASLSKVDVVFTLFIVVSSSTVLKSFLG